MCVRSSVPPLPEWRPAGPPLAMAQSAKRACILCLPCADDHPPSSLLKIIISSNRKFVAVDSVPWINLRALVDRQHRVSQARLVAAAPPIPNSLFLRTRSHRPTSLGAGGTRQTTCFRPRRGMNSGPEHITCCGIDRVPRPTFGTGVARIAYGESATK